MIGGFGAMGASPRFDLTKNDETSAKASASSNVEAASSKDSKSASVLSSLEKPNGAKPKDSKAKPVSKSDAKSVSKSEDFSSVLKNVENKAEITESPQIEDSEANDALAGALVAAQIPARSAENVPVDRSSELSVESKAEPVSEMKTPKSVEVIDERISSILESLNETSETELSMRHLSMRDFLSKMKDEFGIEPQAIVQAFANLDEVALTAPPEQTAEAVLSQLNLRPEQMPKAERFYREMLQQTGESALNETLAGVQAGVSLEVMSEQDLALNRLQKSISNLNDSFARRDVRPTKTTEESLIAASMGVAPVATVPESAVAVAAVAPKAGFSDSNSRKPQSETPKLRDFSSIESALSSVGFSMPLTTETASIPLEAGTSTSAALASALAGDGDTAAAGNAKDIIRNAQILMKNGGGEMKMQLKPEGVGDVTLKVAVKDGQVGIQMVTENDTAKKTLESGLEELKTSLAQHKLHVDAVKIEVGTEMAKQRFEQAQQDSSREQARQMAQDFMGQFRQDREGFRQSFADMAGSRGYQQPKRNRLPEIDPVDVAAVSNSKTNSKNTGERRLNLVA